MWSRYSSFLTRLTLSVRIVELSASAVEVLGQLIVRKLQRLELRAERLVGDILLIPEQFACGRDGSFNRGGGVLAVI